MRDKSGLPDLLGLNTALGYSAQQSLTARGSEWVLLTRGDQAGKVLVIGGAGIVAPTALAKRYESVTVWSLDPCDKLLWATAMDLFGTHIQVQQLSADEISNRLAAQVNLYQLIVIEDSLARLTAGDAMLREAFFKRVEHALTQDGQCCVVTAIDPSLAGIRRHRQATDDASLRQLGQALSWLPARQTYFLYPDHRRPQEILGWSTTVPSSRKNLLTGCLDELGLFAPLHNSVAIMGEYRALTPFLQTIADEACGAADFPGAVSVQQCLARDNGTLTVMLEIDAQASAVLRIPLSLAADTRLRHAWFGLQDLREQLQWLKSVTPESMAAGEVQGVPYYLERRCAGVPADSLVRDERSRLKMRQSVLNFLLKFGAAGIELSPADEGTAERYFDQSFAPLLQYAPDAHAQLADLCERIRDKMSGRSLSLVRIHGDFNPTNVLCNSKDGSISGVIDWDACESQGLPMQDITHFLIHRYRSKYSMNMGKTVVAAVSGNLFDSGELETLKRYREALKIDEDLTAPLLVLNWVRHVGLHIEYRNGPLPDTWLEANFYDPLRQLGRLAF